MTFVCLDTIHYIQGRFTYITIMLFLINDLNGLITDELKVASIDRPHSESFLLDFSGICHMLDVQTSRFLIA